MKNFYAVVRGHKPGIYTSEVEAKQQIINYFDGKFKGFYSRNEAQAYLESHKKDEAYVYVVKIGFKPGIYENREEAGKQVIGYPHPLVRKYKKKNMDLAINFFEAETRFESESIKDVEEIKKNKKLNKELNALKLEAKSKIPMEFKNQYICFLDCEANDNKVISFGACLFDVKNDMIVEEFYETCKPKNFTKMSDICFSLTKLSTEDILKSRDFLDVYNSFIDFLSKYECIEICTWSDSDRKFIVRTMNDYEQSKKNLAYKEKISKKLKFINIQKRIGMYAYHQKSISLLNMKKYYNLDGEVRHHALMDALDTVKVFQLYNNEVRQLA